MKVKGEGRKNKLVECAMCRCVSVRAHVRVREESALSGGVLADNFLEEVGKKNVKQEHFRKKVHLFLGVVMWLRDISTFFLLEISIIRNKRCIFALDKTQPSLFPSLCGVPIAQDQRAFRPVNQRKRSLTY